jgi:hypothetical protein
VVRDHDFPIGLDEGRTNCSIIEDPCNLAECFWFHRETPNPKNFPKSILIDELVLEQIDRLGDTNSVQKWDEAKQTAVIEEMLQRSGCPKNPIATLRGILWKYRNTLAGSNDPVGLCTSYKPRIPLDTKEPVYTPQYPIPFKMIEAMQDSVSDFLK